MILLLAFVLLDPNQTLSQILSLVPSNRKVFRSRPIILVLTSQFRRLIEHILMLLLCKTLLKVQSLASTVNSRI